MADCVAGLSSRLASRRVAAWVAGQSAGGWLAGWVVAWLPLGGCWAAGWLAGCWLAGCTTASVLDQPVTSVTGLSSAADTDAVTQSSVWTQKIQRNLFSVGDKSF